MGEDTKVDRAALAAVEWLPDHWKEGKERIISHGVAVRIFANFALWGNAEVFGDRYVPDVTHRLMALVEENRGNASLLQIAEEVFGVTFNLDVTLWRTHALIMSAVSINTGDPSPGHLDRNDLPNSDNIVDGGSITCLYDFDELPRIIITQHMRDYLLDFYTDILPETIHAPFPVGTVMVMEGVDESKSAMVATGFPELRWVAAPKEFTDTADLLITGRERHEELDLQTVRCLFAAMQMGTADIELIPAVMLGDTADRSVYYRVMKKRKEDSQ